MSALSAALLVCSLQFSLLFVDGRTYGRAFQTHFIRSTQKSRPKNGN